MGKKFIVYRHIAPDGRSYIGITEHDLRYRIREGYKHSPPLKEAVKKFGWDNFKHEILAENVERDVAEALETYYISAYETMNPKKGFNTEEGGL